MPLMDESEIPKELNVRKGELPVIITEEMKKYLPKDLLEKISKADKACREMKRNEKNSFEKVVMNRLPHPMTLRSKATTAMVAAAIRPRKGIRNALESKYKKEWINAIKSELADQVINKTRTLVPE